MNVSQHLRPALLGLVLSVGGLGGLASCSKAEPSTTLPTNPQPVDDSGFPSGDTRPSLVLTPDDLLSDTGATPIVVKVSSGLVSSDTLASIASSTRLRTFPELETVPITTKPHVADPFPTGNVGKDSGAPADYDAYVTVTPAQALDSSRWYVLTVDTVPADVRPASLMPIVKEGPKYGARFRVGSGPVVRQIEVHGDGTTLIEFSEGVAIDPKSLPTYLSAASADATACTYTPPGGTVIPHALSGVTFKCKSTVLSDKRLGVVLTPGLFSQGGRPLSWMDGTATTSSGLTTTSSNQTVDPISNVCGKDCLFWRP